MNYGTQWDVDWNVNNWSQSKIGPDELSPYDKKMMEKHGWSVDDLILMRNLNEQMKRGRLNIGTRHPDKTAWE